MARTRTHNPDRKVCIGAIAGVHGVRGLVRIKSFTDAPEDVAAYGPVTDAAGSRRFVIEAKGMVRGMVETAHMSGGYFMRIGNEITWTTPPEAVKLYLDLCRELAHR